MALSTITSPMSAVFTPPSSCSSHWTYEAQAVNSVPGGLLLQDSGNLKPDRPCQPPGFAGWGRAPSFIQVFSPGACPFGYSTAIQGANGGGTTTAVCCPSNFGYTSIFSTVNAGHKTAEYFGCTSVFVGDGGATTAFAEKAASAEAFQSVLDGTTSIFTTVSGPVEMWAQPITIAFQQSDLTMFETASAPSRSSTAASSPRTATATVPSSPAAPRRTHGTAATRAASKTTAQTKSTASSLTGTTSNGPETPLPTQSTTSRSSLSSAAIAGVGIGAVAVLGAFIGLAIFLRLKYKTATRNGYNQKPSPDWDSLHGQGGRTQPWESQQYEAVELSGAQKALELSNPADLRFELDSH